MLITKSSFRHLLGHPSSCRFISWYQFSSHVFVHSGSMVQPNVTVEFCFVFGKFRVRLSAHCFDQWFSWFTSCLLCCPPSVSPVSVFHRLVLEGQAGTRRTFSTVGVDKFADDRDGACRCRAGWVTQVLVKYSPAGHVGVCRVTSCRLRRVQVGFANQVSKCVIADPFYVLVLLRKGYKKGTCMWLILEFIIKLDEEMCW